MIPVGNEPQTGRNHPLAPRMAVIAGINQNVSIACVFGTFSVMLASVQSRIGVGPELSTLAMSAVTLAIAICAPLIGVIATRGSLRVVLLAGSILLAAGFGLLAVTASYPLYLVAYGLLIGPGMAAGVVLPAALVTRWYAVNRGRTLGFVCAPVLIVAMPPLVAKVAQTYGAEASYLLIAGVAAVSVLANLFIIDRPPADYAAELATGTHGRHGQAGPLGGVTIPVLLRTPRFWALIFPFIAAGTGAIILSAHAAPIVRSWGFSNQSAATLISIQCFAGIAGTIVLGWLADRLGGAWALALVALADAAFWALLLLEPPFAGVAALIGGIGFLVAGGVPALSMGLSQAFGTESFSRAYGLCSLVNLPFSVLCVPLTALAATRTGSYSGAIAGEFVFLLASGIGVLLIACLRRAAAPGFVAAAQRGA